MLVVILIKKTRSPAFRRPISFHRHEMALCEMLDIHCKLTLLVLRYYFQNIIPCCVSDNKNYSRFSHTKQFIYLVFIQQHVSAQRAIIRRLNTQFGVKIETSVSYI